MLNPNFKDMLSALNAADVVYQIGIAPQRIDILTSISGIEFDAAWDHRLDTDLGGVSASVIGRDDLLKNKLSLGRPKDLVDTDILKSMKEQ